MHELIWAAIGAASGVGGFIGLVLLWPDKSKDKPTDKPTDVSVPKFCTECRTELVLDWKATSFDAVTGEAQIEQYLICPAFTGAHDLAGKMPVSPNRMGHNFWVFGGDEWRRFA